MPNPLFDAHLHLQDERLRSRLAEIADELRRLNVVRWVVAGTRESDWPDVARLAGEYPEIAPCFGLHPWFVKERSEDWEKKLASYLSRPDVAAVGEIGLDKWIRDYDIGEQESLFRRQIGLANELNLPVVIHCLRAWGRMRDVLRQERPSRGFLLHSFAGPAEMVGDFVAWGGYFSFSGHFLHERKAVVAETFRQVVPFDRILVETDAPDMRLPEELETHPLTGDSGEPVNHPANLAAVYDGLAKLLGMPFDELAIQVAENFARFYALPQARG
jgi:TatD DNase family protein